MLMEGKFATEIEAAKAHDIVAIKIWGESTTHTNFPVCIVDQLLILKLYY